MIAAPRLPAAPDAPRIEPPRSTVSIVDNLPGKPTADALAAAFESLGLAVARIRLVVRNKPGFDFIDGGAAAHPEALFDATRALLASLPDHDVLLTEGVACILTVASLLAICAHTNASLVALDPEMRALLHHFDLRMYDHRPAALDRIAHTLAASFTV